ncbi:hypothetical protein AB1N83_013062 [Pleurotus pulmonarius]
MSSTLGGNEGMGGEMPRSPPTSRRSNTCPIPGDSGRWRGREADDVERIRLNDVTSALVGLKALYFQTLIWWRNEGARTITPGAGEIPMAASLQGSMNISPRMFNRSEGTSTPLGQHEFWPRFSIF